MARRRTAEMVAAGALGVALALTVLATGTLDRVSCATLAVACAEEGPAARRLPQPRRLSPQEAALSGAYIALGDSFSSGEGVYDETERPIDAGAGLCHRSRGSYVPQIAGSLRFAGGASFWACAGATTVHLLKGQHGHKPQISRVGPAASLVTVSIGGNDAGFTDVLKECILRLPWSDGCTEQEAAVRRRVAGMTPNLRQVLLEIRRRAPEARIIVLGYPRPFPAAPADRVDNLTPDDQRWVNRMARFLNDASREVVAEVDRAIATFGGPGSAEFVDAYDAFDGHEIGRGSPYMNALDVDVEQLKVYSRSYHPTAGGYRRLGELVAAQISAGPGRPLNNLLLP
ncbi:SGNH/GDSL hydrolase family protein [Nonomuraea sp. NPDC050310]|uniref:SGNH/GDSL hydrolase family protein n=1 Tax=Nonomuraea sp. NPDC050310 TaxID=3154935 RepID=UPI0033DC478F